MQVILYHRVRTAQLSLKKNGGGHNPDSRRTLSLTCNLGSPPALQPALQILYLTGPTIKQGNV